MIKVKSFILFLIVMFVYHTFQVAIYIIYKTENWEKCDKF